MTLTYVFAALLVVHGLIHLAWVAPKPDDPSYPFDTSTSKVVKVSDPKLLGTLGSALAWLAVAEFAGAAGALIALPMLPTLWRALAAMGALDSLVLIAIFWRRWFVLGVAIDIAILVAAIVGWPLK